MLRLFLVWVICPKLLPCDVDPTQEASLPVPNGTLTYGVLAVDDAVCCQFLDVLRQFAEFDDTHTTVQYLASERRDVRIVEEPERASEHVRIVYRPNRPRRRSKRLARNGRGGSRVQ